VFDSKVPGFGVRIFPTGTKSFIVFFRAKGRLRRMTLGRYPTLSLREARKLADDALNRVSHGGDPQREKLDDRRGVRFAEAVDSFVRLHCKRYNRENTAHETARVLKSRFVSKWGSQDLREITKADVNGLLDKIMKEGHPSAANHALAAIRKLYAWCAGRGLVEANPCVGIRAPAASQSRDRVLSDTDLAKVWQASKDVGDPFGHIVRLLVLTAQRRGEVAGMHWNDVHFPSATWSIPASRTKSNRAQEVPLVPEAVEILKGLSRTEGIPMVFPAIGNTKNSFSGFSKAKRRLDELAGVEDWTLHDLRRTTATGLARLGVAPHVVERILNHTTGTLGGVAGVYNRFGYLPEMRAALELWSKHLGQLSIAQA
jgi:integrase